MISRVKQWARELWEAAKQPPSTIAALFYSLLAFFGSQAVEAYKHHHEHYEKQVEIRVIAFLDTSREFDALVAVLAHGIIDKNGPDVEDRAKLIANLNRQYSEIAQLEPLVKNHPELLNTYKASIEKLNEQLPQINSVAEMKSYWEAVSDVLASRRKLDQELMRATHLALE
jgi:hypothetical protein